MRERREQVEELRCQAQSVPASARAAFLDQACAGDADLRREVEALLNSGAPSSGRLQIGERVGPYRVSGILGEGGMGIVYKAEDTRLHRPVALKFIKAGFTERLEREARAISALNHPHVATLHDIGEYLGMSYLVLEHLDGKPLKGPLPLPVALDYAVQIACALEAAHAAGIVHRDLKPSNILVTEHGVLKVLDFGLAKLSELARPATEEATQTLGPPTKEGQIPGTVPYMSPEQAEGLKVDTRSDIFSFGAVLYEMISGRRAFRGKSTASVIAALLEREPEPLSGIPEALKSVVCRALRKDPARRWQHIADMRVMLEDVRAELGCSPAEHRPRTSRRLALPVVTGAAVLVLAAAAYFGWRTLSFSAAPGWYTVEQVTDDPGEELNPSLSADGRSVLYASRASGNWDIYLQRVGGKNPINLTKDSPADDTQAVFSPDGERIAFRSERNGGGIFLMGATGESARRLTDFCYLPAWSPDGKEIACSTVSPHRPDVREASSSQIYVIDIESGRQKLVTGGILDAVQPSWSQDGRRIAFWGLREGARDIFTVARDGGGATSITNDEALDWNPVWSPDGKYIYFSSNRGGAMNLWRVAVSPESGRRRGDPEPVNVPASYAAGISFSRDGRHLAYSNCQRSSNLFRVAFDPEHERPAGTPQPVTQGVKETLYPSISRDGAWIAFSLLGLGEDLAVVRADGHDLRRITDDPARHRTPRWSPSGNEIAFMSSRSGRFEIWTVHPDGGALRMLTEDSPRGGVSYPAWSPDGRLVSYNLPDEMGYVMEPGKAWREQEPLVARVDLPERSWLWLNDWSHDGKKVAGTVQKLDGGTLGIGAFSLETKKFEPYTDFGRSPRWLPNDRRLLFHARGGIFLANVETRKSKEILSATEGAINPYFDVSWDGRMIVYSLESIESDIWIMNR